MAHLTFEEGLVAWPQVGASVALEELARTGRHLVDLVCWNEARNHAQARVRGRGDGRAVADAADVSLVVFVEWSVLVQCATEKC